MKFKNDITKFVCRWLVSEHPDQKRDRGLTLREWARDFTNTSLEGYEDESAFDLVEEFSGWLANGLEGFITNDERGASFHAPHIFGRLMYAGFDAIDFDQVAEAMLKHFGEWDEYKKDRKRRKNLVHIEALDSEREDDEDMEDYQSRKENRAVGVNLSDRELETEDAAGPA